MLSLFPKSAALVDMARGARIDLGHMAALVAGRSRQLLDAGVAPGGRVAICHDDSAAILIDLLSSWHIGAVPVPLSTSLVAGERQRLAQRIGPALWIGDGAAGIVSLAPAVLERGDGPAPILPRTEAPAPEAPALVLMTSGTTQEPKGVVLSHQALRERLRLNAAFIGESRLRHALQLLPLHFGHGLIGNALTPLAAGGVLHVGLAPGIAGLATLGQVTDRYEITFLTSVPSLWRVALKVSRPPEGRTLARVHVGSERLPGALWKMISDWTGGAEVFNMYGMTEAANWIGGIGGRGADFAEGAVGTPWGGNFRVRVDDGTAHDRGRGEVLVRSPSLMTGYFQDAAGTARAVVDGWLATGDIGEIDVHGALRLVGRVKHQINNAGVKISGEEIERLLESHDGVQEACAFAVADPVSGETAAAAVAPKPGQALDGATLRRWCEGRIRREAVPGVIHIVGELPRTPRGKLDRQAIHARFAAAGGRTP
jgi:acyl-CoA synthetase (AMP-forming)/AMP-acid ligase II